MRNTKPHSSKDEDGWNLLLKIVDIDHLKLFLQGHRKFIIIHKLKSGLNCFAGMFDSNVLTFIFFLVCPLNVIEDIVEVDKELMTTLLTTARKEFIIWESLVSLPLGTNTYLVRKRLYTI